jgi:hypothetical protein
MLTRQALYHLNHATAFFALVIFQVGPHFYDQAILDQSPAIDASCATEVTGMQHHTQLFTGYHGGLTNCLPRLGWHPPFPISVFYVARITGMSHLAQLITFCNK